MRTNSKKQQKLSKILLPADKTEDIFVAFLLASSLSMLAMVCGLALASV